MASFASRPLRFSSCSDSPSDTIALLRRRNLCQARALNIQQGSRQAILPASEVALSSRKPLTKVTNNLLIPLIKIKMESTDDSSAQQLTPSSVAVPTYACEIMKNIALNTVAD